MSGERLRWSRIVGFGLLAEVATAVIIVIVLQVHAAAFSSGDATAEANFAARTGAILGPGLGVLFTYFAALLAARPVPSSGRRHGLFVGVVTSLLTVPGMFAAAPAMLPIYLGSIVLKVAAGLTAGTQIEWKDRLA
jgi:hypothetical protein